MSAPKPYTHTVNPVKGCLNDCWYCYAREIVKRFAGKCERCRQFVPHAGHGREKLAKLPTRKGKTPRLIFFVSAGDLWSDGMEERWRQGIWQHVWGMEEGEDLAFVCTKRPERIDAEAIGAIGLALPLPSTRADCLTGLRRMMQITDGTDWPRALWVGTTITGDEHRPGQSREEGRLGALCARVPRGRRYVSLEPLLGERAAGILWGHFEEGERVDWVMLGPLTGAHQGLDEWHQATRETADAIREMCRAAGVPLYMKPECETAWKGIEMVQEWPEGLKAPTPGAARHPSPHREGNGNGEGEVGDG